MRSWDEDESCTVRERFEKDPESVHTNRIRGICVRALHEYTCFTCEKLVRRTKKSRNENIKKKKKKAKIHNEEQKRQ